MQKEFLKKNPCEKNFGKKIIPAKIRGVRYGMPIVPRVTLEEGNGKSKG